MLGVAGIKASIVQGDAGCRLYGCYESLQAGFTTRALQDLTGGIVQSFGLSNQDRYLTFQVLNSAVPRSSLLIASINLVSSESLSCKHRFLKSDSRGLLQLVQKPESNKMKRDPIT
jgi:hypothetical protein